MSLLHAHIRNHHHKRGAAQLRLGIACRRRGLHFKAVNFKQSLQGKQDRGFIVDQKNTALHMDGVPFSVRNQCKPSQGGLSICSGEIPPVASRLPGSRLLHWLGDRIPRGKLRMPCQPGRRRCHFRGSGSPWGLSGRSSAAPDVVVVNTCSVTAEADRDARAYIRRVQRGNPQARIVVTGCYAQRAPDEVAALPGVFAVVGNSHKSQVASIALGSSRRQAANIDRNRIVRRSRAKIPVLLWQPRPRILCRWRRWSDPQISAPGRLPGAPAFVLAGDIFAHSDFELPSLPSSAIDRLAGSSAAHRTRPTLKIQDGCGNRCTFCIIPSTRGNSRSLAKPQVLDSVERIHCRRWTGTGHVRHQPWPLGPRSGPATPF